jgi:hypothetical protein
LVKSIDWSAAVAHVAVPVVVGASAVTDTLTDSPGASASGAVPARSSMTPLLSVAAQLFPAGAVVEPTDTFAKPEGMVMSAEPRSFVLPESFAIVSVYTVPAVPATTEVGVTDAAY